MNDIKPFSLVSFLFFMILCCSSFLSNAAIISFAFRDYPLVGDLQGSQKELHARTQAGALAREKLRAIQQIKITSGIYATYAGYLNVSDWFGRITLPLMQNSRTLYIIVTTKMSPIIMLGNTVHHWELEEGTPAKMYKAEELKDAVTKIAYWEVKEVPLPQDSVIPLPSVLIFARPTDLYIPTGIYPTQNSPHMLLPDIYVKSSLNRTSNALYVLNINQFFGTMHTKGKANIRDLLLLTYP